MRFTDAYAAAPVCSPTRASILTGQYPARIGTYDFISGHKRPWAKLTVPRTLDQLPLEHVTIAEALAGLGYVSACMGKWHLGDARRYGPGQQGFAALARPRRRRLPPGAPACLRQAAEFERANPGKGVGPLTEQAVRFMVDCRDRPFLCFLSHHAVHIPLQARAQLVAKYEAIARSRKTPIHPSYAAMVEAMDESVGVVLGALAELKLAARTMVVFFSDNGGLVKRFDGVGPAVTTNAPLRAEKGTLYEGGIRVPLIVRLPGVVKPAGLCRTPVISNDFYPTLLAAAGGRPKDGQVIDGVSLLPLLRGGGAPPREALYWHYPAYHHATPAGAIREGDYKLIEFFEDGRAELYNLAADIGESTDLAAKMPSKAGALGEKLKRWRRSINAPMPAPNPDHDPAKAHLWGARRPAPSATKEPTKP